MKAYKNLGDDGGLAKRFEQEIEELRDDGYQRGLHEEKGGRGSYSVACMPQISLGDVKVGTMAYYCAVSRSHPDRSHPDQNQKP